MYQQLKTVLPVLWLMLLFLAPVSRAEQQAPQAKNGLFPEEIVSADELNREMSDKTDLMLLDARNLKSFEQTHIEGAQLPRGEEYYRQEELFRTGMAPAAPDADKALVEWAQTLDKGRAIVTYCNSNCHASATLALRLKQLGFTHVRSMEEGVQEWEKKGYAVAKK